MLVTEVGDEMYRWQLQKSPTSQQKSPTSKVTNIAVARITNTCYESIFIKFSNFFFQKNLPILSQKYSKKINNDAVIIIMIVVRLIFANISI